MGFSQKQIKVDKGRILYMTPPPPTPLPFLGVGMYWERSAAKIAGLPSSPRQSAGMMEGHNLFQSGEERKRPQWQASRHPHLIPPSCCPHYNPLIK